MFPLGVDVLCASAAMLTAALVLTPSGNTVTGLFEQRVDQYLEELPDTEQSGVNKFLKGLGEVSEGLFKRMSACQFKTNCSYTRCDCECEWLFCRDVSCN